MSSRGSAAAQSSLTPFHVVFPLCGSLQRVVDQFPTLSASVLLWGARGSGRHAVAAGLAARFGKRLVVVRARSVEDVRGVVGLVSARQSSRLLVVDVDGVGERGQHILLKVLEENVANHVVVIAEHPLPTVVSRCVVARMSALPRDEVAQVLCEVHQVAQARAEAAAGLSAIPVRALSLLEGLESGRANAMAVLRAAREGDVGLLSVAAFNADSATLVALGVYCSEALSGRWEAFAEVGGWGVSRERLVRALTVCGEGDTNRARSSTYVVGKLLSADGGHRG